MKKRYYLIVKYSSSRDKLEKIYQENIEKNHCLNEKK